MNKTKIEWCDSTLNPVVGCTFNCTYCYARRLNNRFKYIEDWNKPQFFSERLNQLKSKKSKNIFMNSMSDVADWKDEWIHEVAKAIHDNPQHNYLFLTKRPKIITVEKFYEILKNDNVWIGVSATNAVDQEARTLQLTEIKRTGRAKILGLNYHLFVSFEPLHGSISAPHMFPEWWQGIEWIIIGAETGNRKEKIVPKASWIEDIVLFSKNHNISLLYKNSMIPVVGEYYMRRELPKELIHE